MKISLFPRSLHIDVYQLLRDIWGGSNHVVAVEFWVSVFLTLKTKNGFH